MKILTVYFTRTSNTEKIAEEISSLLNCEILKIQENKNRNGPLGWIRSGIESSRKQTPKISQINKDLGEYDLVLIGTPIWAGTMASPVRSFLQEYKEKLPRVAFFCTMDGDDASDTFSEMEDLSEKSPEATVSVSESEIAKNDYKEKLKKFAEELG